MAKTLLILTLFVALFLINCSTALRSSYPKQLYSQQASDENGESLNYNRELLTEASAKKRLQCGSEKYEKQLEEADVLGYLDNPTPVYITESQGSTGSTMESGKYKTAMQQLAPIAAAQQKGRQIQSERLITYDASITTRSPRPDSVIGLAITMTQNVKGYVESRGNASVTLRVPAACFDTVFNALLKIGEIVDFRKSAEDITDAFQDANLRIQILNKTIQQYLKLVNQVKEEAEKIRLLKEIENLREELENLEVQKKTLALRAQYAKIIVSVRAVAPHGQVSLRQEIRGFEWVHWLDPFKVRALGKNLELAVPAGMVRIQDKGFCFVESADGTKVWSSSLANKPEGSAKFWSAAVRERIKGEYYAMDTSSAEGYEFIRLTPYPGSNYIYIVGLCVKKGSLHVVQAYFPDEKQEKRYFQAVLGILGKERS